MWIGLIEISEHEGTFRWEVDNSNVTFTNWEHGEPNDWTNTQACVTVGTRTTFGLWDDYPCGNMRRYICEKPANGKFNMLNVRE